MKHIKIFSIIICMVFLLFNACNPTKDFDDLYDQTINKTDSINFANYTKVQLADTAKYLKLSDKDYAKSSVSNIKNNKNFSEAYPAKTYLTEIMNKAYIAKAGNQLTVNYNYYFPLNLQKDSIMYTFQDNDYPNQQYKNFSSVSEIFTYLTVNYPQVTRGKIAILTYKIKGVTGATTCAFVYLGSAGWMQAVPFSAANYTSMGQAYANFNSTDDARYIIPIFLKNSFLPYAKAGDKIMVQYIVYKVSSLNVLLLNYDGNNWKIIDAVISSSSTVAYTGNVWNFIPPLKFVLVTDAASRTYTLTDADYALVGSGQYKDFDRRAGQSEGDVNVFLTKIGTILKTRFADIAANQIYAVTYKDYNGSGTSNVTVNVKTLSDN